MEENILKKDFVSGVWSEKVIVITDDFEITGQIFMPKTGKRNRALTEILNGKKRFIAIKDCELKHRHKLTEPTEKHEFIQVNLESIVVLRPHN